MYRHLIPSHHLRSFYSLFLIIHPHTPPYQSSHCINISSHHIPVTHTIFPLRNLSSSFSLNYYTNLLIHPIPSSFPFPPLPSLSSVTSYYSSASVLLPHPPHILSSSSSSSSLLNPPQPHPPFLITSNSKPTMDPPLPSFTLPSLYLPKLPSHPPPPTPPSPTFHHPPRTHSLKERQKF